MTTPYDSLFDNPQGFVNYVWDRTTSFILTKKTLIFYSVLGELLHEVKRVKKLIDSNKELQDKISQSVFRRSRDFLTYNWYSSLLTRDEAIKLIFTSIKTQLNTVSIRAIPINKENVDGLTIKHFNSLLPQSTAISVSAQDVSIRISIDKYLKYIFPKLKFHPTELIISHNNQQVEEIKPDTLKNLLGRVDDRFKNVLSPETRIKFLNLMSSLPMFSIEKKINEILYDRWDKAPVVVD